MAESLTLPAVVDTLVNMDLVDLSANGPWPGEPDSTDVYEPDWSQVHPTESETEQEEYESPNPSAVFDEVRRRAEEGFRVPPPDVLDALAWYTPIHYFGLGAAIYIRESAVLDVAATIVSWLSPLERRAEQNIMGACRAAMSVLYLHEAFHHKVESLAIRYEMVERTRRYIPYTEKVVIPLLDQPSGDVLEEALACAEMYRRFKTERPYHRGIPPQVQDSTIKMLPEWFKTLPPSYCKAGEYLSNKSFDQGLAGLMGQVQEATTSPRRDPGEWDLAPHIHRGLFDCQRITHVLVPVGQTPLLPWFAHAPALPSVSTRRIVRFLERDGWKVDARRGKGSHVRLSQAGKPSLTIPANRESLSPAVLRSIAQALSIRIADLQC